MNKVLILIAFFALTFTTNAQPFQTPAELADEDGAFITANDASIYYVALGSPHDPAVIFIHGFGGSTLTWRDTLQPVADAGFYAIALDLPPFGLSDKNPALDFSRSGMADTVAHFMQALDIPSATIVGHSMGGSVTAQFAVRHPDKVDALVFVAGGVATGVTTSSDNDDTEQQQSASGTPFALLNTIDPQAPAAPILLRALVTRNFFADSLRSAYYDPDLITEEVIDGYARLLLIEEAPIGFLAYVQAQETAPITLEDLVAVADYPIQIMWGIQDTWVTIGVGEAMAQALPDASFITYNETGHLPMEERPADFVADLLAFLSSN